MSEITSGVGGHYKTVTVPTSLVGTVFLSCTICGNLVFDTEAHENYHKSQDSIFGRGIFGGLF